jgi:ADP-ribose pyrophosphatase YjhB (NUDIX family)
METGNYPHGFTITSPHIQIPECVVNNGVVRLTVGLVVCTEDSLLLVRTHDGDGGHPHKWGVPQEGVKPGETLIETAQRCFIEELNCELPSEAFANAVLSGAMANQQSDTRIKKEKRIKLIHFLLLSMSPFSINLNTAELAEYRRVKSFQESQMLLHSMKERNRVKYDRVMDVVVAACMQRFLTWRGYEWPEKS